MADDINKSDEPINGKSPAELESNSIVKQFEKVRQRDTVEAETIRQYGKRQRQESRQLKQEYRQAKEDNVPISDLIIHAQRVGFNESRRQEIGQRYLENRARTDIAAQNILENKTAGFLSDSRSRSRIIASVNSTETLSQAMSLSSGGIGSFFEQDQARNQAEQRKSELSSKLESITQAKKFDATKYSQVASEIGKEEDRIALAEKTMGVLKKRGDDPAAQSQKVEKYLEIKKQQDLIEEGKTNAGKKGYTQSEISEERKGLTQDLQELRKAFRDGTKDLEAFSKESKKATDRLDDLSQIEAGVQQGGGGTPWRTAGRYAGAISMMASAASVVGVNYEIEQTQQRAAFANLVNEKYENTRNFTKGDMGSFLRLAKTDEFAKQYSDTLRSKTVGLKGAESGALMLQGVANGAAAATGPGDWFMKGGGKFQEVIDSAASPTIQGGLLSTRLAYGIEQGQSAYQAYKAPEQLGDAVNAIPASALNAYVGGQTSLYRGGQGVGSGRGALMQNMGANISNFTAAGISLAEAAALSGQVGNQIGTTEDITTVSLRAAKAQQRGVMGANEYVGAAAQLSNVGGSSGDLEDIMAKAVTSGMENAKNINQMVSATASMASASAASGINVSDIAQERLTASVQALRKSGVNENMAAQVAANSYKSFASAESQMGTFADYQFRARAEQVYGRNDIAESSALANMKSIEMEKILKGGDEALRIAQRYGLENKIGLNEKGQFKSEQDRQKFEKIAGFKFDKGLTDQLGTETALSYTEEFKQIRAFKDGKISWNQLTPSSRQVWSKTGEDISGYMRGGEADKGKQPLNTNENEAAIQKKDILKNKFEKQEYIFGQQQLSKLGDLPTLMEMLAVAVSTNTPEKMAEEVEKAAKELSTPASTFGDGAKVFADGSKKFNEAVIKFINYMDKLGVGGDKSVLNKLPSTDNTPRSKTWRGNSSG